MGEKGGLAGAFGVAEQTSDVSLACRQYGPIQFKEKFGQGDVVFRESRSLVFKRMQIVRGCDVKRNVLVYMVYSDKLIEGSPKNVILYGRHRALGRPARAQMRGIRFRLTLSADYSPQAMKTSSSPMTFAGAPALAEDFVIEAVTSSARPIGLGGAVAMGLAPGVGHDFRAIVAAADAILHAVAVIRR